jgi:DNA replication protein DnaC
MRRQTTEWGSIFSNNSSDERLMSRIYKNETPKEQTIQLISGQVN